ncbi:hypothetical protein VE00_11001 [Pseudogymnoascus sp. WSF 3629]|nr:hypothetical protein VE00_11001 [Pseudogymnoascus sp. WSF 3629]
MKRIPTSNILQDNDGQPSRMTTQQTTTTASTAALSKDIPDRMTNLEIQMQEIKEMIANLAATQTRIPSSPLADSPIPTEYPPTPSWSKEITLPYHSREASFRHPAYQSDANRRDLALYREDRRHAGGRSMDMKVITLDSKEITDTPSSPTRNLEALPLPQKRIARGFTPVQICEISANAFHHEMMRSDSEFF